MPDNFQEEKLRQEILGDAKVKAERTIARAKNEADKSVAKAMADSAKKKQDRMVEAQADADARCRAIMLEVQRETRRHWLLKREACLDEMFSGALATASSATGVERVKSLAMLAEEAIAAIGPAKMEVTFRTQDADVITIPWLEAIAAKLFGADNEAAFALSAAPDAPAGISFATEDGRRTFDNTYASRLKKMKDDLRIIAVD